MYFGYIGTTIPNIMKIFHRFFGTFVFSLSVMLFMLTGCNEATEPVSVSDVDSLIHAQQLYELPYDAFSTQLDTLAKLLDDHDEPLAGLYFKLTRYGYPLNHCLATHDTAFEYVEGLEKLITNEDLNREDLLTNEWYREFLSGYLDLSAKYQIEGGNSPFPDQMFIRTQWLVAERHMKGTVLDAALLGLMKQQIGEYGMEGTAALIKEFNRLVENEIYRSQVKLRYSNLLTALHGAKEYTYLTDGKDTLSAFVYRPHAEGPQDQDAGGSYPTPCIVIAHGGGWYLGHPLQRNHMPRQFTDLGVTAVCIEYRIKGRTDDDPVTGLMDVKAAIRWVRNHAEELNIDPDRIIISGLSAGGHLAAAAALIDGYEHAGEDLSVSSRPDAAILWSGCVDPTIDHWFRWCMGRLTDEAKLSPLHNVDSGEVPFLVFQGTNDEFLDHNSHIAFRDSMTAKGNACTLHLFEGLTHTQIYELELVDEYREFLGDRGIWNAISD